MLDDFSWKVLFKMDDDDDDPIFGQLQMGIIWGTLNMMGILRTFMAEWDLSSLG